jgi:MoxR-like ATPase
MTSLYYTDPLPQAETGDISGITGSDHARPEPYLPDKGLIAAVKVSLMLGRPLLLTGEPGSGKTRLAYHLAWDLGLKKPLRFDTKSDSRARDLFYIYDAIAHFHAAQILKITDPMPHIQLNALGLAVLRTHSVVELQKMGLDPLLGKNNAKDEKGGNVHNEAQRSLVLIDEIDKAPRDFPNDILNEVENLCFTIPELRRGESIPVHRDPKLRPILILTSNSEKHLPDAFLRRCIYYDIPFPKKTRLWEIIDAHLQETARERYNQFNEALDFFLRLRRNETGLKKKPATAELLNWLLVINQTFDPIQPMAQQEDKLGHSLSALIKSKEDLEAAKLQWQSQYQSNT